MSQTCECLTERDSCIHLYSFQERLGSLSGFWIFHTLTSQPINSPSRLHPNFTTSTTVFKNQSLFQIDFRQTCLLANSTPQSLQRSGDETWTPPRRLGSQVLLPPRQCHHDNRYTTSWLYFTNLILTSLVPDLLTGAFGLWIPGTALILSNLSLAVLQHLSNSKSPQPYIDDWKNGVWKVNVAVFELGLGVSRLAVLLYWMLKDTCISILVFSLALLLNALVLIWEGSSSRYGQGSAAVGEFYAQLEGCTNAADVFEYLATWDWE